MTTELVNRCTTLDGPAITMLRERTSLSYQAVGAGRLGRAGLLRGRRADIVRKAVQRFVAQRAIDPRIPIKNQDLAEFSGGIASYGRGHWDGFDEETSWQRRH